MARRRLLWLDITARCSGHGHGCEIWLTEWSGAKYTQKQHRIGFSSNMTMILPRLTLVRDHPAAWSVSGGASRTRITGQAPENWQDRGIMPDQGHSLDRCQGWPWVTSCIAERVRSIVVKYSPKFLCIRMGSGAIRQKPLWRIPSECPT
jgi:hypothetical protein